MIYRVILVTELKVHHEQQQKPVCFGLPVAFNSLEMTNFFRLRGPPFEELDDIHKTTGIRLKTKPKNAPFNLVEYLP